MAASTKSLIASEVKVGGALPELSVDVTPTTIVLGAMATRDWRPMHHDKDFAVNRNGTRDIFMNTPNQAAWFERYLTDWTGPKGRPGRMKFRMKASVFPGDTMVFSGTVDKIDTDDTGCTWADVAVHLKVGDKTVTTCATRIAIPATRDDNPWKRRGDRWKP
jgi:acyl dehydratase